MKTIPSALQAHYDSGNTTLARLVKVTRLDATVYGFTDHDRTLTFGGVDYEPTSVFDASAISTRAELNVDNLEIVGLLDSAGITEADIEAGRWDHAQIEVLQVNWADLTMGAEILRVGEIGNIQRKGSSYTCELRGLMQKLQNNIGDLVTPSCNAQLGDARCAVDLDALTIAGVVVTDVNSEREFEASSLGQDTGYFALGEVVWLTGLNTGLRMDIREHSNVGGLITLALKAPFLIQIGDTFDIKPGCNKSFETCSAKFNNAINFRGFPRVPGKDKTFLVGGQKS